MAYNISPDGVECTAIQVLEQKKFYETPDGQVGVRTGGTGSIIDGVVYDAISVSYPNTTTEVFEYYSGGLAGALLATVTVIYVDSDKCDVSSVVRT